MIRRIRDYDKKPPSRDAHKIYVICEGSETEPAYFNFFKGLSSNLEIIDVPSTDGHTDPLKLKAWAEEHLLSESPKYHINYLYGDRIWFVIDTDNWEINDKITTLRTFCSKANREELGRLDEVKPYDAWQVAQSNPCFEIWLYYHFFQEPPVEEDLKKYASFKDFLANVLSGGFDKDKDPARLETAIANAQANFRKDADGKLMLYATEMHLLGNEILKFIKKDLDKIKNKLG